MVGSLATLTRDQIFSGLTGNKIISYLPAKILAKRRKF